MNIKNIDFYSFVPNKNAIWNSHDGKNFSIYKINVPVQLNFRVHVFRRDMISRAI